MNQSMRKFYFRFESTDAFIPFFARITKPCDVQNFDRYVEGWFFVGFFVAFIIGHEYVLAIEVK